MKISRQSRFGGVLAILCATIFARPLPAAAADETAAVPTAELESVLEGIRNHRGLPALACSVIRSNTVVARAAVGLRKSGGTERVTLDDRWHQGSITKSMTATLAAILVEEGKLKWSTPLSEAFPAERESMDPAWRDVTLEQLLGHRGGAPDQEWLDRTGLWKRFWSAPGAPRDQRRFLFHEVTRQPPAIPPGTRHVYSNTGYILAGTLLEQRMGIPWERLIQEWLFRPLGMKNAGFGPPDLMRNGTDPWGHRGNKTRWEPMTPGPQADNPPGLGPAGTVHASLADLEVYVMAPLNGELGRPTPLGLPTAAWRKLHTALALQAYALGWGVVRRSWTGGDALNHTGSNTLWFSNAWLAPRRDFVVVVLTNVGGDDAAKATDEVAAQVIAGWLR